MLTSCINALNQAPDGKLSMDEVWNDPDMVEQMLNAYYNNIPQKAYTYHWFDPLLISCSDDGWSSEDAQGQSLEHLYRDNNSAQVHYIRDNPSAPGGEGINNSYWDRYWAQIRLCSQFLENIDKATVSSEENRARLKKALAHAVKTKALLFAASPLHNEGHAEYWEEAYQAAKTAVQELKANGYELFTACTNPSTFGTGKAAALHQLVCLDADYSASPRDKETIYQHKTGGLFIWHIGYIGSGEDGTYKCGTCPTQELIDAFETEDGVPVLDLSKPYNDEKHLQPNYNPGNTTYQQNAPYEHRDPRMSITALYNGAEFIWNSGERKIVNTAVGGQHEPSWVSSDRVHSRTGYYHKKMVTPGASNTNQINNAVWKFYRLGELLLDYAEAAAEAGHSADARTAANEVRARSGMPAIPDNLSKDDLVLRIHNERRIELAWEEPRYFDLRRWQKPDGDLSAICKYLTAMVITVNGDGTFNYTRRNVSENPRGGWANRDLLLPLPLDEASRLEPLTGEKWQNPGW
jgi:hypothetical protein